MLRLYRFVFGFSSEGEHKVRPYIGFGHWLDFGIFSRQHFPLTCTYAHRLLSIPKWRNQYPHIHDQFLEHSY